jgi:hypothetical protein
MGWSWSIGLIALALLSVAVIQIIRPGSGEIVDLSAGRTADLANIHTGSGLAELHRFLPNASADLGRPVLVAGTIVGQPSRSGFWVRDLRDNIVFVMIDPSYPGGGEPRPGRVVRVRGVIVLFPPAEQADRLHAAGLVIPAGTVVVREVKILATDGGIELLND